MDDLEGLKVKVSVTLLCPCLCESSDYSPPGSSVQWDSPGKNTGVGCHALLQCFILSEIDQTEQNKYHIIALIGGI